MIAKVNFYRSYVSIRNCKFQLHVASFQTSGLYLEYWRFLTERNKTWKTTTGPWSFCLKFTQVIYTHISLAGESCKTTPPFRSAETKNFLTGWGHHGTRTLWEEKLEHKTILFDVNTLLHYNLVQRFRYVNLSLPLAKIHYTLYEVIIPN